MKKKQKHLNTPITADEIEAVIKNLQHTNPGPDGFTGEFYRAFKGELNHILPRLFQKFKKMEDSQTHFMKPALS